MNNTEHTYQRIDDYLNGRMGEQELIAFNQELDQNEELRDMVALEQATNEAIFQKNLMDARADFTDELNAVRKTRKVKKIVITSTAILAGLGALLFFNNKNTSEKQQPGTPIIIEQEKPLENDASLERLSESASTRPRVQDSSVSEESNSPQVDAHINSTNVETAVEAPIIDSTKTTTLKQTDEQKENTPPVSEEKAGESNTVPCPTITITNKKTSVFCEGETGSFTVKAQGGTSPYSYTFDGQTYTSAYISSISPGVYELHVVDQNGCTSHSVEITFSEKRCYTPEKAFTPANGAWTYKSDGEELTLKIMNSRGQLIYETTDIDPSWNGQNNHGEQTPRDAYIYIVEFENGTSLTGTVTLVP